MSQQEDHKIQIAYEVVEKYEELDQEDFEEQVLDVVEMNDEGLALGAFIALQVILSHVSDAGAKIDFAKKYVTAIGGIEFLEKHLEGDNEIDHEIMTWLRQVFNEEDAHDG